MTIWKDASRFSLIARRLIFSALKSRISLLNGSAPGAIPFSKELLDFHAEKIQRRAEIEKRVASFQMVIDDVYAISKGRLVGRP